MGDRKDDPKILFPWSVRSSNTLVHVADLFYRLIRNNEGFALFAKNEAVGRSV